MVWVSAGGGDGHGVMASSSSLSEAVDITERLCLFEARLMCSTGIGRELIVVIVVVLDEVCCKLPLRCGMV